MRKDRFISITMLVVVMLFSSLAFAGPAPVMDQPTSSALFVQDEDGVVFEFASVTEFQVLQPCLDYLEYTSEESQRWQTNHAGYRTETAIKQRQQRVSRAEM